jgi:hypothetical protein
MAGQRRYSNQLINHYANVLLEKGAYALAYSGKSIEEIRDKIGENWDQLPEKAFEKLPNSYARSLVYDKVTQRINEMRELTMYPDKFANWQKDRIFQRETRYARETSMLPKKQMFPTDRKGRVGAGNYVEITNGYSTREVLTYAQLVKNDGIYKKVSFVLPDGTVQTFTEDTVQNIRPWLNGVYTRLKGTGVLAVGPVEEDEEGDTDKYSIFFSVKLPENKDEIVIEMDAN